MNEYFECLWNLLLGHPSPFHRPNIFAVPTRRELIAGWRNVGGVHMVNCLNPNQTAFPQLTLTELYEVCGGPYGVHLAPSYLSSYRVKQAAGLAYINLATYHQQRTQALIDMQGWVFDQQAPPHNWYGVWPGCTLPNTKPWEPLRVLVLPISLLGTRQTVITA